MNNLHNLVIKKQKEPSNSTSVSYYKLPYIGKLTTKISKRRKYHFKNTNIKVFLSPFKVGDLFSAKESVPKYQRYFVVYRSTCPGCYTCYIGETTRHLIKRIKEHLETESKSHISKQLNTNRNCKKMCHTEHFKINDSAISSYRLKLKEAMHINVSASLVLL